MENITLLERKIKKIRKLEESTNERVAESMTGLIKAECSIRLQDVLSYCS